MNCEITWLDRGCYRRFFDRLCDATLQSAVDCVHGDSRFDRLRYVINDLRDVTDVQLTESGLSYVAAVDYGASRINANIRIAIIAVDGLIMPYISQYLQVLGDAYPCRVFPDYPQAHRWASAT